MTKTSPESSKRSTRRPPDEPRCAYQRALDKLALRDHSEEEIRRALRRAECAPEEIEAALAKLRERRYIDDDSYAARFARSRIENRGMGRHRVRQALRQRGVDRDTAERGLDIALEDVSESEALDGVARRYWRAHERDEPRQRLRKLCVHLYRRGFPGGLIFERLHALWPRWTDALEGLQPLDDDGTDA